MSNTSTRQESQPFIGLTLRINWRSTVAERSAHMTSSGFSWRAGDRGSSRGRSVTRCTAPGGDSTPTWAHTGESASVTLTVARVALPSLRGCARASTRRTRWSTTSTPATTASTSGTRTGNYTQRSRRPARSGSSTTRRWNPSNGTRLSTPGILTRVCCSTSTTREWKPSRHPERGPNLTLRVHPGVTTASTSDAASATVEVTTTPPTWPSIRWSIGMPTATICWRIGPATEVYPSVVCVHTHWSCSLSFLFE